MPTPDQPTASDREADLQRICEEVGLPSPLSAVPEDPGLIEDYAKEVARRYAATVGAGVPEEVRDAMLALTIDGSEPQPVEREAEGWGAWTEWTVSGGNFKDENDALAVAAILNFVQGLLTPPSPEPSPSEQE